MKMILMDQMDMMTMNTENLYDSYSEYLMSTMQSMISYSEKISKDLSEIHIDDVHEHIRKIREEKIDRILNEST